MNLTDKKIIEFFDSNFFWRSELSLKRREVDKQSELFVQRYPALVRSIIDRFRQKFEDWEISRLTYFIAEDRCLSFVLTIEKVQYTMVLSIFNYFMVWNNDSPPQSKHLFIEPKENQHLDAVYHSVIRKILKDDFVWVSRSLLNTEIEEFNLRNYDINRSTEINEPIYFYNLLTRL